MSKVVRPLDAEPILAGGPDPARPSWRLRSLGTLSAYFQLTKPRIVLLLLITTVPAMILARRGVPSLWLIAATLVGGTMSAGGANTINQFVDRDIDEVMTRTRRRPLPARAIEPGQALAFGIFLGAAGFLWLVLFVNLPAALLSTSALLFYVFVYTLWLKRSTPRNIVIGGAAGAAPALVGWAAVTGRVGWPAVVLFAIVFVWTPPHFWALSLRYQGDYAMAGVPMLPVVAGREATTRQILAYSLVLAVVALVLWPVAHTGVLYPLAALALGSVFVAKAVHLRAKGTTGAAMSLFRYSIAYLAILFGMVAVDALFHLGP
ncbi:MAG TPA: heme o synthase [Actinomycetota bacterium]|jgi:protoheme IX farnesyltransferase|nr:heme o synthase [Actinomycetota bacterium]